MNYISPTASAGLAHLLRFLNFIGSIAATTAGVVDASWAIYFFIFFQNL
jgi:hypothetical protein